MTATRWWVKLIARWLARIDGVKSQVQMFSLAITAFSTFSIMLQGFGLGGYVPYLGIGTILIGIFYTYFYTEHGVWNQVSRDRQDMSNNFAGPGQRIQAELIARAFMAAQKGEPLDEQEEQALQEELGTAFPNLRDGVELED